MSELKSIGDYIFDDILGTGSFASVKRARHKLTNTPVAIKIISKNNVSDSRSLVRLKREISLIKNIDHPFVAEFFEQLEDDFNYYIVMEYAENGNLLDFVNNNGELPEDKARTYFFQLISVLEYLHNEKKIAHRDLKAENVLLDRHNNLRLIDFGLSNIFSADNPFLNTTCGSPAYAAPEMIKGQAYTASCDIWSSGILLYAICVGELPFQDDNTQRLLQKIVFTEPSYPSTLSPQLIDLLSRILKKDPTERITIDQIKCHPWFSEFGYVQFLSGIPSDLHVFNSEPHVDPVDREIVQHMSSLGIDSTNLVNDLLSHQTSSATAIYCMLRKEKITDCMKNIRETYKNISPRASPRFPLPLKTNRPPPIRVGGFVNPKENLRASTPISVKAIGNRRPSLTRFPDCTPLSGKALYSPKQQKEGFSLANSPVRNRSRPNLIAPLQKTRRSNSVNQPPVQTF